MRKETETLGKGLELKDYRSPQCRISHLESSLRKAENDCSEMVSKQGFQHLLGVLHWVWLCYDPSSQDLMNIHESSFPSLDSFAFKVSLEEWWQVGEVGEHKTGCMNIKTELLLKLHFIFSWQTAAYKFMAGMRCTSVLEPAVLWSNQGHGRPTVSGLFIY